MPRLRPRDSTPPDPRWGNGTEAQRAGLDARISGYPCFLRRVRSVGRGLLLRVVRPSIRVTKSHQMFRVIKELFRQALEAESDRLLLLGGDPGGMLCAQGHRWLTQLENGTPVDEWSCGHCRSEWLFYWENSVATVRAAMGSTILTAPLWLPYALLVRVTKSHER